MLNRTSGLLILLVLVGFSLGCSPTLLESNWGKSYETARKAQILNRDAGRNPGPVEGVDGQVAQRGMQKYQEGAEKR